MKTWPLVPWTIWQDIGSPILRGQKQDQWKALKVPFITWCSKSGVRILYILACGKSWVKRDYIPKCHHQFHTHPITSLNQECPATCWYLKCSCSVATKSINITWYGCTPVILMRHYLPDNNVLIYLMQYSQMDWVTSPRVWLILLKILWLTQSPVIVKSKSYLWQQVWWGSWEGWGLCHGWYQW